jgi:HlyD family secretion protein
MKTILPATLAIFAAALLGGCAKNPSAGYQGYVEGEYVYVASPLGGALMNLAVARGEMVKPGQLLFELERASEAAALAQAEKNLAQAQAQLDDLNKGKRPTEIAALTAQLEQAKASLKFAESDLARSEQLGGSDVVSKEELDRARSLKDSAAAQVNQSSADLETARLGAREDTMRAAQAAVDSQRAARDKARWAFDQKQQFAPADAQVHDTLYRSGEFVTAGSPVVALLPPGNVKVRFFVPQGILPQIKIGQAVSVHCDGAPKDYSATVNYISTQAEYTPPVIYSRETRAEMVFMVEAKISPAAAPDMRPGQPVDVTWN